MLSHGLKWESGYKALIHLGRSKETCTYVRFSFLDASAYMISMAAKNWAPDEAMWFALKIKGLLSESGCNHSEQNSEPKLQDLI